MGDERRIDKRVILPGAIRYQHKGSQKYGNSLGRNISKSGIGFIADEFFPVSTQLVFELHHPRNHDFVKAVGEIVWITNQAHSERYSMGARFLGPPLTI